MVCFLGLKANLLGLLAVDIGMTQWRKIEALLVQFKLGILLKADGCVIIIAQRVNFVIGRVATL